MKHGLKMPRTARSRLRSVNMGPTLKIGLAVLTMLMLFVGAGIIYTWYMSQQPEPEVKQPEAVKRTTSQAATAAPDPNAPVGVSVQSMTSPLVPGANASITIRTTKTAECAIKVVYDTTPSTDSGLVVKTADEYGTASWTWTVEPGAPLGKWPVTVTCTLNQKSGMVVSDLELVQTLSE